MSMREVAKHLAAMGRHGDTTLVHMSPQEVSALQGIASINGTHLTHNPHTGLPEAFSLGGFFRSLLPTIVGAVAAPLTGGSSLAAVLAGAATGAALNGGNPLMGALMGGLGGYGGAGIGNAIQGTGAAAAVPAGAANTGTGITESAANAATSGGSSAGFKLPSATASLPNPSGSVGLSSLPDSSIGFKAPQLSQSVSNTGSTINPIGSAGVGGGTLPTLGDIGVGGGAATQPGMSGLDKFVQRLGGTGPNADLIAAGKVGAPLAMAGLAGIEPPKMPEEDKYDPYAKLNLGGDSGLRFFAEGGDVNEMPDPGSNPLEDAQEARSYGIGGLSYAGGGFIASLLQQIGIDPNTGKANKMPVSFNSGSGARFAKGGYLDGPGDGMSDSIPASIEGKQPARLADGEFVVPADVVSHLGNGSTKAGAQRLYAMMDKVRHARTGTTKQGRQINPKKYLPA